MMEVVDQAVRFMARYGEGWEPMIRQSVSCSRTTCWLRQARSRSRRVPEWQQLARRWRGQCMED